MRTSWQAAGLVVIVLALWMISGLFKSDESDKPSSLQTDSIMAVEIKTAQIDKVARKIVLQGQLDPVQHLFLKAQTSGAVESVLVQKGARVSKGAPLVLLDQGGRQNTLAEAQARVKTAQSAQTAAESLRQQRLQSQLQLEQSEAALEAALAQLASVELDISNTSITAPFSGIVNDLPADTGDLIERGDVVAELVDDSAFDVSAQAAQQTTSELRVGQSVIVELITGQTLQGSLTYISAVADPQTRSFRVEARVQNTTGAIAAGVSASVSIPVETVEAVFISPSALSLGDDGELGVKAVDNEDRVIFLAIELVSTALDGAWVSGIPVGSRLITTGQGFVNVGEQVSTVDAGAASGVESGTETKSGTADNTQNEGNS